MFVFIFVFVCHDIIKSKVTGWPCGLSIPVKGTSSHKTLRADHNLDTRGSTSPIYHNIKMYIYCKRLLCPYQADMAQTDSPSSPLFTSLNCRGIFSMLNNLFEVVSYGLSRFSLKYEVCSYSGLESQLHWYPQIGPSVNCCFPIKAFYQTHRHIT